MIDDGKLYSMIHDASALRMSLMWGAAGCLPYRSRFWMFPDVLRLQVMCVFPSQDASPTGPKNDDLTPFMPGFTIPLDSVHSQNLHFSHQPWLVAFLW